VQSITTFTLASRRSDPGLFCDESELTLGGVPLLVKTQSGHKLRPASDLNEIFDAAYGLESGIDLHSRLPGLLSVTRALDKGDRSHAMMLALMLRLPNIGPGGMERLSKLSAVTTTKYDDSQPRDWHGRWTGGNSSSQAAPTGSTTQALASHLTGHWPDIHQENPNIVLTQGAAGPLPIFPPLFPGGPLNPQTPKKQDPGIIFPAPDIHQGGAGQGANDNAGANAYSATDNQPQRCPDPSFERDSIGRTPEQLSYQSQIGGQPHGYGVFFNGASYDGCRESDGTLLEAKLVTPWFLHLPQDTIVKLDEYKDTVRQAFQQNYRSGGRKVEWHFSDPRASYYWRNEFARLGYSNIKVEYTPYSELRDPYIGKREWQYLHVG